MPLAIDAIRAALDRLARNVHPNIFAEILVTLTRIRDHFSGLLTAYNHPATHRRFHTDTRRTPGEQDWQRLVTLTDQALDEESLIWPCYRLGVTVGQYQLDLDRIHDHTGSCDENLPDPASLFRSVGLVPEEIRIRVPILQRIVDRLPCSHELGLIAFLQEVLNSSTPTAEGDALLTWFYAMRVMRDLELAISNELLRGPEQDQPTLVHPSPETWLGWDQATFKRNQWIYEQWCAGTTFDSIIRGVREQSDWEAINSISGIKRAGRAYSERAGLPTPPRRQHGRPRHPKN